MLSNPIFLIATVITVVVVAIGVWLKSMGKLEGVLKSLFKPIQYLIDKFNEFTDSLGLTSHEAEANAEKMQKANEKSVESSKKRSIKIGDAYDYEIAKAKANGKDITDLEIAKSKALGKEAQGRLNDARREYNYLNKHASEFNMERRKKLREQVAEEKKILADGRKERKLLAIQDVADDKKQADEDSKARAEKAKEYAKNRQDASRTIRDIEISLIKDDSEREIATTNEKYRRLAEDAKKNANLTNAERITLMKLYEVQRIDELNKASQKVLETEVANAKRIADGIKAFNEAEAQNKEDIYEVNYQAGLTAREKELQDAQYQYDALLAEANRYGVESNNITEEYLTKKAEIDKKYADKVKADKLAEIEAEYQVRNAKIQAVSDYGQSILNLGILITKDQKKLEKINKASALIQIGIDTAMAISSLVKASNQNPANGVTMGASGAIQFASGILQITSNMVKAKQLLSNPSGNVSGGGGGGGGSESSTSVTQATPAVQMFGQGNNLNSQGGTKSANANQNMVVTAIVSESDITNTQTKLSKLQKNAEL
jgi:hypothetical protein